MHVQAQNYYISMSLKILLLTTEVYEGCSTNKFQNGVMLSIF